MPPTPTSTALPVWPEEVQQRSHCTRVSPQLPSPEVPTHRHTLVSPLTRQVERSGAVIVCGIHHGTLGYQEVNEGCLPCRVKKEEELPTPDVKPQSTSPILCPGSRHAKMSVFCWGGARANVKSGSADLRGGTQPTSIFQ